MKKALLIIASAAMVLLGCTKEEDPQISISASTLAFGSNASSQTFTLNSNVTWTAVNSSDWFTATPTTGKGSSTDQTITVTVTENTGAARTGTVTYTAGTKTVTLTVNQEMAKTLLVAPESVELEGKGGNAELDLTSTLDWTAAADADWIKVTPASGSGSFQSQKVAVAVSENEGEARKGTITFTAGSLTATVAVSQKEYALTYGGVTYKTVVMKDGNRWMAENLRYIPDGMTPSKTLTEVTAGIFYPVTLNSGKTAAEFSTDEAVIASNGYLYQSEVALGLKVGDIKTEEQAKALEGAQGICPEGWHIPTSADILGLVGKAVSPLETNESAPYYDSATKNSSIELLNADGFNADCWGAVSIIDNTKTTGTIMGYLKAYSDHIASGFVCGSSLAGVTYNTANDSTSGIKNVQFYGFMPMKSTGATFNGSKVSYRIAASVRCVKNK